MARDGLCQIHLGRNIMIGSSLSLASLLLGGGGFWYTTTSRGLYFFPLLCSSSVMGRLEWLGLCATERRVDVDVVGVTVADFFGRMDDDADAARCNEYCGWMVNDNDNAACVNARRIAMALE